MGDTSQTKDLSADAALFSGHLFGVELGGMIATFHENERPLHGLAGLLDWRLAGAISEHLRTGALSGKPGECAYLPVTRGGRTYHIVLVGAGSSKSPGQRSPIPAESLHCLRKNLSTLKLSSLGVSRSDFGNVDEDYFSKHLKGISLCIVQ